MKNNKKTGDAGEYLAATVMRDKGYEIITKNYVTNYGEIDIIAKKEDLLVFCEVKTRMGNIYGSGRDAVNNKKKKHIWKSAMEFLSKNEIDFEFIEFHVIEIMISIIKDSDPKGETYAGYY